MKFNYRSDHKKFKPDSRVKITFMDGKNEVTKKVRIISIGEKSVSFEDKEAVYECSPLEIINIRNLVPISFKIKLILFLCFSWIILPLSILVMISLPFALTKENTSLQDIFRNLKDLLIPFIFFFLLNFPNKSYAKYQKIICWLMIIADMLALFGVYFIGSHF